MRAAFLCLVVVVAATAGGCQTECNSIEPAFAGEANDETWRVMLDARAQASAGGDAPTITAPGAGADVSPGDATAITWDSPLQTASSSSPARRAPRPGLLDVLSQAVFPRAHAHLAPITSDLYLVEIDVPGRTCPVAGLTTDETFAFDADSWAEITDAPGERTLRIMSAFVTENRITEGPFLAEPVAFAVVE